jgi:hypothetical protein
MTDYEFVSFRPRVAGEHPLPGVREWQRFKLKIALEVSEIVEVLMVANQSDLCGLIPLSMQGVAREFFGLRPMPMSPKSGPTPVKLVWHASRDADQGHAFLRKQLAIAANDAIKAS